MATPDDDATELLAGSDSQTTPSESAETASLSGTQKAATERTALLPGGAPVRTAEDSGGNNRSYRPWVSGLLILLAIALSAAYLLRQPERVASVAPSTSAVDQALSLVAAAEDREDMESLPARLLGLSRQQGAAEVTRDLLRDATVYVDLLDLADSGALTALHALRTGTSFSHDEFEQAAHDTIDSVLPSRNFVERLSRTESAWQAGELVTALDGLRQLAAEYPETLAGERHARYSSIVSAYESLSATKGTADYGQHLLVFYLNLNPVSDRFYWQRLDRDAQAIDPEELAEAIAGMQQAARHWQRYHDQGGISGEMRQQVGVDPSLSLRSEELLEAQRLLRPGVSLLQPATATNGAELPLFPRLVTGEIQRQRRRLEQLLEHNAEPELSNRLSLLAPR